MLANTVSSGTTPTPALLCAPSRWDPKRASHSGSLRCPHHVPWCVCNAGVSRVRRWRKLFHNWISLHGSTWRRKRKWQYTRRLQASSLAKFLDGTRDGRPMGNRSPHWTRWVRQASIYGTCRPGLQWPGSPPARFWSHCRSRSSPSDACGDWGPRDMPLLPPSPPRNLVARRLPSKPAGS